MALVISKEVIQRRNLDLKRDYLSGLTMTDLIKKYDISPKRVYDVLGQLGIKPNRRKKKS